MFSGKSVTIDLFKPNFTDDDSQDNDCSENESQADDQSSEVSN